MNDDATPPVDGPDPEENSFDLLENRESTFQHYKNKYWDPARLALDSIDIDKDSSQEILKKINKSIEGCVRDGMTITNNSTQIKVAVFYGLWSRFPDIDPTKLERLEVRREQIFQDLGVNDKITVLRIYERVRNQDPSLHPMPVPGGPFMTSEMKLLRTIDRIADLI